MRSIRARRVMASLWLSYGLLSGRHSIETGATYDAETVTKLYDILLQPDNYLNPGSTTPTSIVDDHPNVAHSSGVYVQDGWQMSQAYRLPSMYEQLIFEASPFSSGCANLGVWVRKYPTH